MQGVLVQGGHLLPKWQYRRGSRGLLWCSRLLCKLLRPGNPWSISECILLQKNVPRDHPIMSLMLQELPTLVVVAVANEGAMSGMHPMFGLLPLVLEVHRPSNPIPEGLQHWACGYTRAQRVSGLVCCEGTGCRCSWMHGQPLPTRIHPFQL